MKVWAIALIVGLGSCRSPASGPYSPPTGGPRQTAEAEVLTKQAAEIIETDPERAEQLLREALTHDLFFGPAHNNLGVLHLKRGKLYEAAGEFEWARKLMPGHPDPRVNLALTLERAGTIGRGHRELLGCAGGLPRVPARDPGAGFADTANGPAGRANRRVARNYCAPLQGLRMAAMGEPSLGTASMSCDRTAVANRVFPIGK